MTTAPHAGCRIRFQVDVQRLRAEPATRMNDGEDRVEVGEAEGRPKAACGIAQVCRSPLDGPC